MAQSAHSARVHRVTLDTKSTELAPRVLPGQYPLALNAYLYCFDASLQQPPRYPAYLGFAIFQGPGVDFNSVWTVTAAATEINYPNYPTQSAAKFLTNRVAYDYSGQALGVNVTVEPTPNLPLRVGIMATLGKLLPAYPPAESAPPSSPPILRAAYRASDRQPQTVDWYKDPTLRTPHRPSERPLRSDGDLLPDGQIGGIILGPFSVRSFLFCSTNNENEWVRPGLNTLWMNLRELGLGTVWTVNADVSELAPPRQPTHGSCAVLYVGHSTGCAKSTRICALFLGME